MKQSLRFQLLFPGAERAKVSCKSVIMSSAGYTRHKLGTSIKMSSRTNVKWDKTASLVMSVEAGFTDPQIHKISVHFQKTSW